MKLGHSFKDYICPDSFEFDRDCFRMGDRYGRVLFLKDYAAYLRDDILSELSGIDRPMILSIDVVPIPMDEAIRDGESRLLGVERNIVDFYASSSKTTISPARSPTTWKSSGRR